MAGIYKGPVIENKLKAELIKSEKNFKRSRRQSYTPATDVEIEQLNNERTEKRRERLGCGRKGGFRNGPGKALSVGVEVIPVSNDKFNRPRLVNDVEQIRVLKEVYKGAEDKYKAGLKEKLKFSRVDLSEDKAIKVEHKVNRRTFERFEAAIENGSFKQTKRVSRIELVNNTWRVILEDIK